MRKTSLSINQIKIIHTAIWFVMASSVLYILYCGIFNITNPFLYAALGLIALEIVVLLLFRMTCPLVIVAKDIKSDWKDGDDIFIPTWLAIHNKTIFGSLLLIGILLLLFNHI